VHDLKEAETVEYRMKIEKLLFATKFEELQLDALQSLLNLKKAALNHVVFLNVIERDKVAMRRGTGFKKEEAIRLKEKANIRFIDWAENLFEQGMEVGVYIVVGGMARHVIQSAKKEEVDLIVIGPQKKSPLEKLYAGSDILEIIRGSNIPVLVFKYLDKDKQIIGKPFERPLLATDFSAASQRAVDYFLLLGDVIEEIHIIHVVDEKQLTGDSAMSVQKARKTTRSKLDSICDQFEAQGVNARVHVYVGETASEIEKAARECRTTMVVSGTSGKSSWREKLLGSAPQTLAEKSPFPTLLIPPGVK
jgi:nucleotide-binding universal stress UspA family protein